MKRRRNHDTKRNGEKKYVIPAVEKAFAILALMVADNRGYTISGVSRELGLPISSTSSLLYTLLYCGYLKRDDAGRFFLSMKLVGQASDILSQIGLRDVAMPELQRLHELTHLMTVIALRDGNELVYVEVVEGTGAVRIDARVGKRMLLHQASTGKVLLSSFSEEELADYADETRLPAATDHTITSASVLAKEIQRVRIQGYAIDDEESGYGIRGIAAPLLDHEGNIVAALCVAGTVFELDEEGMDFLIGEVKKSSMRVSEKLGYQQTVVR